MKKLSLINFLFWINHPRTREIDIPPSSPFVKRGITAPPFGKGRLGGIFFLTNSKGISVIFLVIAMLLMVTIGYVFSYLIPTKQKSVVFPIQSTQAFFIAQSGVEFAVRYAKDQGWSTPAQLAGLTAMTRSLGAGSFTLTYTNTAPTLDTLTSVGYVPTGTERRRIVVSNFSSFLYYFAYHRSITVGAAGVSGGPLLNFPMLVSITDTTLEPVATGHVASYNAATGDPWDIIFEGRDDTTCGGAGTSPCKLNHEIELYNPATGQLVAWVQVPSINNNTVIYMYYGNSCMTASTQNATGVWNANYMGVWHLSQSPTGTAPQMKDSTSHGYNGTANGGFVAGDQQAAMIDGGLDFESAHNDYVTIAAAALGTTSVTVSAWIKVTSFTEATFGGTATSDGAVIFSTRDANTNVSPTLVVSPALTGGGVGTPNSLIFCDDTANIAVGAKGTTAIATGTWYYAVGTFSYNAGTATYLGTWNVYLNGALNHAAGGNNFDYAGTATVPFSGASWILGNNPQWSAATTDSNVILDEVRVSNIARSAAWILTEYNNQSNPGNIGAPGFYAVGAEQNN